MDRWETVVHNRKEKKTYGQNKKTKIKNKEIYLPQMPVEESNESSTKFDVFSKKQKSSPVAKAPKIEKEISTKLPIKTKKSNAGSKSNKALSSTEKLNFTVNKINLTEIQEVYENSKKIFPDTPLVWLNDLVSFLNYKLEKVNDKDISFLEKSSDYPLCLFSQSIKDFFTHSIRKCKTELQEVFLEKCFSSMIFDFNKGLSICGYRIFIQLLCFEQPSLINNLFEKYINIIHEKKNHTNQCLLIMWALAQAGYNNFDLGYKVWHDAMLPFIKSRQYSTFVINYLVNLFRDHNTKKKSNIFCLDNFQELFSLIFTSDSCFSSAHQHSLIELYPIIKEFTFHSLSSNNIEKGFSWFLSQLSNDKLSMKSKDELLSCLEYCLSSNNQCFDVWKEIYSENITQSRILLNHIITKWKRLHSKLNLITFEATLHSIVLTNQLFLKQENISQNISDFKRCDKISKELLEKMKLKVYKFPWASLILLSVGTLFLGILYDSLSSKSFSSTYMGKLLNHFGLLNSFEPIVIKIGWKAQELSAKIQVIVPQYFAQVKKYLTPFFTLVSDLSSKVILFLINKSQICLEQIHTHLLNFISWIANPNSVYFAEITDQIRILGSYTMDKFSTLLTLIIYYYKVFSTWLVNNILSDKFYEYVGLFINSIATYSTSLKTWTLSIFSSKI